MKPLYFIVLLLSIASCTKVKTSTLFQIECNNVTLDNDSIALESVVGYAFYADTASYIPKSYSEAVAGKMSSVEGSSEISKNFDGRFETLNGTLYFDNVSQNVVTFVVCDTSHQVYAYRRFNVPENLDRIITSVNFEMWAFEQAPDTTLIDMKWIIKK